MNDLTNADKLILAYEIALGPIRKKMATQIILKTFTICSTLEK